MTSHQSLVSKSCAGFKGIYPVSRAKEVRNQTVQKENGSSCVDTVCDAFGANLQERWIGSIGDTKGPVKCLTKPSSSKQDARKDNESLIITRNTES